MILNVRQTCLLSFFRASSMAKSLHQICYLASGQGCESASNWLPSFGPRLGGVRSPTCKRHFSLLGPSTQLKSHLCLLSCDSFLPLKDTRDLNSSYTHPRIERNSQRPSTSPIPLKANQDVLRR